MNFVCSAIPLGVPFIAGGGFSGSVEVTAPFIIPGSGESVTSLACADSLILRAVLTQADSVHISFGSGKTELESITVINTLSGMDDSTQTVGIYAVAGIDGETTINAALDEMLTDTVRVSGTTGDYAYSSDMQVCAPLSITGLSGSNLISLPQAAARIISDTLTVKANGTDITKHLLSAEIDVFAMSLKAEFAPCCNIPETVQININEEVYTFNVEGFSSSHNGLKIYGRTQPDKKTLTLDRSFIKASELAALCGDIIWSADDLMLRDIYGTYTGMEAAELTASASGLMHRLMPDGRSLIFRISADNTVHRPDGITGWTKTSASSKGAFTEVIYGPDDSGIAIVPETRRQVSGGKIRIRIYGGAEVTASAKLTPVSSGNTETVTENIVFENGRGRLSKPSVRMLTQGVSSSGRDVYTDRSVLMKEITYRTVYDIYEISSDTAGEAAVFAVSGGRALYIKGNAEAETVYAPHLTDHVSALNLAKRRHSAKGPKMTLRTCHSCIINSPCGLNIETPYGKGALTGAKISIQTDPARVTDILEVLQWQK